MEKNLENNLNIIYDELLSLTGNVTNYFAGQLQDYTGLINYMEQMSSEFKSIFSKIKLPKSYTEKKSQDYLGINCFFDFHCFLCGDFQEISEKIKTEIISPLQNFQSEFESDNKLIFFSLNSLVEEFSNQKATIKDKNSAVELLTNIEKKFLETKTIFEKNENKKTSYIYNYLNLYFKLIHNDLHFRVKNEDELLKKYKQKREKNNMKDLFPDSKILKWKNWGKNALSDLDNANNKNMSTSIIEYYIPKILINNNIIGIDDDMVFQHEENKIESEAGFIDIMESEEKIKDNITINNFLYGLDNLSPKDKMLLNIEDVFGRNIGNKQFYFDFCDKIVKARGTKKTLYEIKLFSNLVFLTNVMNLIIDNIKSDLLSDKVSEDILYSFKILDVIICIGEKAVSEDTYMCALLSKNKIFKEKKVWINSIRNKIIILLNELCTKEYESKEKVSIFKKIGIKSILPNKKNLEKIIGDIHGIIFDKEKNLIESCGFDKLIKYYNKLSSEQKKNLDNNALSVFHGIIKCYIRHITNYNFHLENETDIISEICENLRIKDESYIIFYCCYYQDCLLTTKKINAKNLSRYSNEIKEKISYIKSENKMGKNQKKYEISMKNDNNKYLVLEKVCNYLEDKDKFKLIGLGKNFMKIKKYIYKRFLKDDISLEKRLIIWKSYLKFNSTSALYDYKSILEETTTEIFKKENEEAIIQINKDINRTYFRTNNENIPNILYNILTSFIYSENKINYVQGINSITGFIYDLTQNEEDTFRFLICLFNFTQIRDIYDDEEFQYLKILFYSMERILYLFLPKVYSKLKDQNLQISFFMSAYFITMFTILYSHLPENDISFLLHIWDEFIFEGWKSFFEIWLAILKFYEKDILNIKEEDIMNFLANKIRDCELFKKEKYETFLGIKNQFKITEELMINLEYEIAEETGIRKVGASAIIEDFNDDDKKVV